MAAREQTGLPRSGEAEQRRTAVPERGHGPEVNRVVRPGTPLRPADVLALQRSVGNRAVGRILSLGGRPALQRAVVAGVRNDTKSATDIGDDMHLQVQQLFINSNLPGHLKLYYEVPIRGRRADIVAMYVETDDDGMGGEIELDRQIWVGEIKPDSEQYIQGVRGSGASQLDAYIDLFKLEYPHAAVGKLDFWDPPTDGQHIVGGGYDCYLYIRNERNGMYHYKGRVNEQHSYAAHNGDSDSDTEQPFI